MQINTYLYYKKGTKNTVVYACSEEEEAPMIPTLYVRKEHLPANPPTRITVSIVFDE